MPQAQEEQERWQPSYQDDSRFTQKESRGQSAWLRAGHNSRAPQVHADSIGACMQFGPDCNHTNAIRLILAESQLHNCNSPNCNHFGPDYNRTNAIRRSLAESRTNAICRKAIACAVANKLLVSARLLRLVGQVGSAWVLAALPRGIRFPHTYGSQAVGCLGAGLWAAALCTHHTPPSHPWLIHHRRWRRVIQSK